MSERAIPDAALTRQIEASDPEVSAFVSANAGSGKTHVLAQRVIRLLLAGVEPEKILCITFTKAAAANMTRRVFDTLAAWTSLDDPALEAAMRSAGAKDTGDTARAQARRLFAQALETPGGLKVHTIHAFCTRILHLFPFEANVAARFEVLDERAEDELLGRESFSVLLDAAKAPASALGRALASAIASAADVTFQDVVRDAIGERDALQSWIEHAGGVEPAIAQLSHSLGIDPADTLEKTENDIVNGPHFPFPQWAAAAAICKASKVSDQKQCERLSAAIAASGPARVDAYLSVFFTTTFEPRKAIVTQTISQNNSDLAERLVAEQSRLVALLDRRRAIAIRDRSAALIAIASEVIARYRKEKDRRGLLDYDDLIDRTLVLLATDPSWVHYKLDYGIDHVLIDEAQDTSEKQWQIIRNLVSEFAAGEGARSHIKRTVFAVGDEKQSIFSFQGAAPRHFDTMRREFEKAFLAAERAWRFVRLQYSFRSGANVVGAVDDVFGPAHVFKSITTDTGGVAAHETLPDRAPGLVEIWDLETPADKQEIEGWQAPFDELSETSPQVRLARKIATWVQTSIANGTRAGDILVLVRQRGALFESVIRALKDKGVAVAGADRLKLTEHIAIEDLMALADALLLPQDDLSLAVALKSPIFGIDEDQLFELAYDRKGSLRDALRSKAANGGAFALAAKLLADCEDAMRRLGPFDFYAWLLGPQRVRAAMLARLGPEAADPLDEFLELALDYERREIPSLQGFVSWVRAAETEIKRDMDIARNEVRVMTVHGAKGLEAPFVILADTTTSPTGPYAPRLLHLPAHAAPPGTPSRIVWAGAKATDVPPVANARQSALDAAQDEYRRLLYVAMTRAADCLIVAGYEGERARPEGCWYDLIFTGLEEKLVKEPADDGAGEVWRYRKVAAGKVDARPAETRAATREKNPEPDWLQRDAPASKPLPTALTPSSTYDETTGWRKAAPDDQSRRRKARERGNLIHRLMQSLPDIAAARREDAARRFLAQSEEDFSDAEQSEMAAQVLKILGDPRFAALFTPGSRAEVPIVGHLKRGSEIIRVSGQVDRLIVAPAEILIADYKTNRPAPESLAEVPPAYLDQLALYRAVLTLIYPGRDVRAALIWTDRADLMEIPASALDAKLASLTSAPRSLDRGTGRS